ncbi:hypothetical protein ACWCOP_04975 [Maricaulaceae bacterium MS644]
MSDQDTTDPRGDLAYVRAMTDRAARAPLLGGRYLLFWSALLSVAYTTHYLLASGLIGTPPYIEIVWLAFGLTGGAGMVLLSRGAARKPGQSAVGNRVEREVWRGAGIGIFLFVAGVVAAVELRGAPMILFDFIASVALVLYGAAMLATAAASGETWLRAPAGTAFVAAAVTPVLAGEAVLYLFLAGIMVLIGVAPGVRLLRAEPPSLDEDGTL